MVHACVSVRKCISLWSEGKGISIFLLLFLPSLSIPTPFVNLFPSAKISSLTWQPVFSQTSPCLMSMDSKRLELGQWITLNYSAERNCNISILYKTSRYVGLLPGGSTSNVTLLCILYILYLSQVVSCRMKFACLKENCNYSTDWEQQQLNL